MYFNSLSLFEKTLHQHRVPEKSTLDVSKIHGNIQWSRIFKGQQCPLELTIDFGDSGLAALDLPGFFDAISQTTYAIGLTLCFWGKDCLSKAQLSLLIDAIASGQLPIGCSLYLSGANLEHHDQFNAFLDAIASPKCPTGMAVYFDESPLSSQNIDALITVFRHQRHPQGFFVHAMHHASLEQQTSLKQCCLNVGSLAHTTLINQQQALTVLNQSSESSLRQELRLKTHKFLLNRWPSFSDKVHNVHHVGMLKCLIRTQLLADDARIHLKNDLATFEHQSHVFQYMKDTLQHPYTPSRLGFMFDTTTLDDHEISSFFATKYVLSRPGLTFSFHGSDSLGHASITTLIHLLTHNAFGKGLTLTLSGDNFERCHVFTSLVDTITSTSCVSWLTLHLHTLTESQVAILLNALKERPLPVGLRIQLHVEDCSANDYIELQAINMSIAQHAAMILAEQKLDIPSEISRFLSMRTTDYLQELKCDTTHLTNIDIFKQRLMSQTLPAHTFFDATSLSSDEKKSLNTCLTQHGYPLALTIDFNQTKPEALLSGLFSEKASVGLTLQFKGNESLNLDDLTAIQQALFSKHIKPGFTLILRRENFISLDKKHRETQYQTTYCEFIDCITSLSCPPWLSIDFNDSVLSHDEVTYLIEKLQANPCIIGLFITYKGGSEQQRCTVRKACERALRLGQKYLAHDLSLPTGERKFSDKEHQFLNERTTDALYHIQNEKYFYARDTLFSHREKLKQDSSILNTKQQRVDPLLILCENFSTAILSESPQPLSISSIIQTWKNKRKTDKAPSYATLMSAKTLFNQERKTSTELLLQQLENLDYEELSMSVFSLDVSY
jgi:hypothetical protein